MIGPGPEELQIRNQMVAASLGGESPITFYQRLIDELRTGKRDHPNIQEFRDIYDYMVLMGQYANALILRVARMNEYITQLEDKLREFSPEAVLPKLGPDSSITIDGRTISFAELVSMLASMQEENEVPD